MGVAKFPRAKVRIVLWHYRLEIYKELTSGVNIYIAMATYIIQRIFESYKGKIYFSTNLGLRVLYTLLGNIVVGEMITEVLLPIL